MAPIYARKPKTGERVVSTDGGQTWHIADAAPGSPVPARQMSKEDRTRLNAIGEQAVEAQEIQQQYKNAAGSIKRLKPGPWRARFLDAAIPEEKGGLLDTIGSVLIGGPARALGAISPQEVNDFQRLKGLQSERVLSTQIQQKGPQTESDAARMQMTEISPYKSQEANRSVIDSGMAKTQRIITRAPFYTQWANKYGLNGVDENGRSVDQAWAQYASKVKPPAAATTPTKTPGLRIQRIN